MEDDYKHPADEKKVRFRKNILGAKKKSIRWTLTILFVSFFLSASMLFISAEILEGVNNIIALGIVLIIVFIGIMFDIIGIAVTAADETPFHAMASRKVLGARQAIKLIRNANKVSSFCNDVIGDICGVISGTAGALIVIRLSQGFNDLQTMLASLVVSGCIASLTVGGKSIGKTFAIEKSNLIVYKVGKALQLINVRVFNGKNNKRKKERR